MTGEHMNLFRSSICLRVLTSWITVALLSGAFTLVQTRDASADACLEDAAGDTGLSCSSNDVQLASIEVALITDGCDFPGDTFTFDGFLNVETNATTRYDIVYFIGDDPLESTLDDCVVETIDPIEAGGTQDGDACGDVTNTAAVAISLTTPCVDGDGDGFFDISACSIWDNNKSGPTDGPGDAGWCEGPGAQPGTGSKCNCQIVNTDEPVCDNNADCDYETEVCTDNICDPSHPDADVLGCVFVENNADCEDGLFCNGADACVDGVCQHDGDPCEEGPLCGSTCNEEDNNCFAPQGTVCRTVTGVCDVAEVCDGSTEDCPDNEFLTSVCRAANGICDV
jgi:hypothetical protein